MEQKSPPPQPLHTHIPPPSHTLTTQTDSFMHKVKYFLTHNASLYPQIVQIGRTGHGFVLKTKNNQKIVSELIEQTFNTNLQHFMREARRTGFTVRSKNTVKSISEGIILQCKQKIIDEKDIPSTLETVSINSESQSQEQDDFPKEEEIQSIMKSKEQKGKVSFIKPHPIANKVMSQGDSALPQWKKNEDASIEVKLEEQDYLSHIFSTQKKDSSKEGNLEGEIGNSLADRNAIEKQNYKRCSKMIDSTIIQLLQAHRSNKIQQHKQDLMNNIVQIYDMLSNSIDNIAGVMQLFGGRQPTPKKQQIVSVNVSSSFKNISQG